MIKPFILKFIELTKSQIGMLNAHQKLLVFLCFVASGLEIAVFTASARSLGVRLDLGELVLIGLVGSSLAYPLEWPINEDLLFKHCKARIHRMLIAITIATVICATFYATMKILTPK